MDFLIMNLHASSHMSTFSQLFVLLFSLSTICPHHFSPSLLLCPTLPVNIWCGLDDTDFISVISLMLIILYPVLIFLAVFMELWSPPFPLTPFPSPLTSFFPLMNPIIFKSHLSVLACMCVWTLHLSEAQIGSRPDTYVDP